MKTFFVILFCFSSFASQAQSNIYKYYWNSKLETVPQEQALILGKGKLEGNVLVLNYYDASDNHLLATSSFLDSTLSIYNGPFVTYHRNSKIANTGSYKMGKEEGLWTKSDSLGRNIDSTNYEDGRKINIIKRFYSVNGSLNYYQRTDSINDTYNGTAYDSNGIVIRQFIFKGQLGEETTFKNGIVSKDSLYTREEIEAEFPGGTGSWKKYLQSNLNPNVGYKNKIKPGIYKTVIRFNIDVDGTVTDIKPETSFGYGLEEEAIRIIKKSGKWVPAKQFGRFVKAYRIQPVSFVYE